MTARRAGKPFVKIERRLCLSCAACAAVCAPGALLLHGLDLCYDAARCEPCTECFRICPTAALTPAGGRFHREGP